MRMPKHEHLSELVEELIEKEPKSQNDENFLLGLVYEKYLGENAEIYTLNYCEVHFRSLGLPSRKLVKKARSIVLRGKEQ
jgi:hypothetical protein